MHILTFSPEYPPLQVGGLARHVKPLSEALVKEGHKVTVITQMATGALKEEMKNGIEIIRVKHPLVNAPDFASSILQINFEMVQAAGSLILKGRHFDLIHGHDWLVIMAARTLKHQLKVPLIMTIHATEHGRNHGIYNDLQRYINDLEWLSCYEAWRVIVCSNYMKREIQYLFQVPEDKIDIIENGVEPEDFSGDVLEGFRENYAHPDEKMVFFVGRLVQEKGVQVLIESIPEILFHNPQTKFVIAGKGPKMDELKDQATRLGVYDRCYFTGFIDDKTRNNLYRVCDLAVFPSLYEPFGIVALEAMAAKVPVLVTNVGGMAEIVEDGVDGIKVHPGSPHELAQGILRVLKNPELGKKIQENGFKKVKEKYNWPGIAKKTNKVYQRVYDEYLESDWGEEITGINMVNEKVEYRYQTTGK
ncbi:glycosyl transferase family 1 [Anoxybacter fermentans]|uniref:Glycosyl transferase family 1 n=1 Tax=Anoxybacter fermentans TaxID=1323375 RepID=A0A3Q9HNR3_9FIRM|nr:glycosyltransferase family 4 protein [Anoxybacter fermentans]AZR72250.1 glycosyl transferase family 1 [Anoxybacter fermentans]